MQLNRLLTTAVAAFRNHLRGWRFVSPFARLHAYATRSYYEAQIQLKRRQWPWHLRAAGVPFLAERQRRFYLAMFGLLARVASADGRINSAERDAVQNFATDDLRLSASQVVAALRIFREAHERPRDFDTCAEELYSMFSFRPNLRRNVLDALIDMAYADRVLNPYEDELLRRAVSILRLTPEDYDILRGEYAAEEELRRKLSDFEARTEAKAGASRTKRWNRRTQGADAASELLFASTHYDVLGCSPGDSAQAIKRCYRRLVLKHHPDRLAAQGLPEEFRDAAKRKFQEIQEAYETILRERRGL